MNKAETVAEIVGEMREWDSHSHLSKIAHDEIVSYADQIEAAYKREIAALCEALREAIALNCGGCSSMSKGCCTHRGRCSFQKWHAALAMVEKGDAQ